MALIKCPECSKEVSSEAQACPHCGKKLNLSDIQKVTKSSGSFLKILIKIIAGIFALMVVYYALTPEYKIKASENRRACLEVAKAMGQPVLASVCDEKYDEEMRLGAQKSK